MQSKSAPLSAVKEVRVSVDRATIGRVERGVSFEVEYINDGVARLGTLSVSQGGLYWRRGRGSKPRFVHWEAFSQFMLGRRIVDRPKRKHPKAGA